MERPPLGVAWLARSVRSLDPFCRQPGLFLADVLLELAMVVCVRHLELAGCVGSDGNLELLVAPGPEQDLLAPLAAQTIDDVDLGSLGELASQVI